MMDTDPLTTAHPDGAAGSGKCCPSSETHRPPHPLQRGGRSLVACQSLKRRITSENKALYSECVCVFAVLNQLRVCIPLRMASLCPVEPQRFTLGINVLTLKHQRGSSSCPAEGETPPVKKESTVEAEAAVLLSSRKPRAPAPTSLLSVSVAPHSRLLTT